VQPRPGSDGHLAIGMAKVILAGSDVDPRAHRRHQRSLRRLLAI